MLRRRITNTLRKPTTQPTKLAKKSELVYLVARFTATHGGTLLPLLPSGPDGVHKPPLYGTQP